MSTITIQKAKDLLESLSRDFASHRKTGPIKVTDGGEPTMVLLSVSEYESLTETSQVSTDTDILKSVRTSLRDKEEGRVYSEGEANDLIGW